jgi:hypothetical protein
VTGTRSQTGAFEYIAKYFENSLAELQHRNTGVEGVFRRIDANRFTASVYKSGKKASQCTVFMGGAFVGGIAYLAGESMESNSYGESLTVEADDQQLYLRSMGMAHFGGGRDAKLSEEGAAEFYWSMLIGRLQ